MSVIQAIVLGLIQGLGEFLPISSSAHLILVPWFLGWPEQGLTFDVALHVGTLLAVTVYFWRDLLNVAVEGLTKGTRTPNGRLGWGIVLGTIPAAVVGLLFEEQVETVARRSYLLIGLALGIMGIILYWADRRGAKERSLEDITLRDMIWIGIGQAMALIPGVSRSGATITAGLFRGLNRETAARVSFLLSWPVIFGAGVLALKDISLADMTATFWVGVGVSAVSGYAVIAFLLDYLRRGTLLVFAYYRTALAALTILVAMIRM